MKKNILNFNKNKKHIITSAALTLAMVSTLSLFGCSDNSDTINETTTNEASVSSETQLELTTVTSVERDKEGKLTTVVIGDKTYDLTTDLKDIVEVDSNTTGYVMNDNTVFYEKHNGNVYYEKEVIVNPSESNSTTIFAENNGTNNENNESESNETTTVTIPDETESESSENVSSENENNTTSGETETTTVNSGNDTTTKPNETETTTKKPETQTTTKKPEPTTSKKEETTSKKEEETTPSKPKHESGRLKDCELWLISQLRGCEKWDEKKQDFVPGTIYDPIDNSLVSKAGMLTISWKLDAGWDNTVAGLSIGFSDEELAFNGDDFDVKYTFPEYGKWDEYIRKEYRMFNWHKKYIQHIYDFCEDWVANPSKYGDGKDFAKYLKGYNSNVRKDMLAPGVEKAVINHGYFISDYNEEWAKEWCYFDETKQKYRTFTTYTIFEAAILEKDGYFDDVNAAEHWVRFNSGLDHYAKKFDYVRWYYDAKTDKTTIYIVFCNG